MFNKLLNFNYKQTKQSILIITALLMTVAAFIQFFRPASTIGTVNVTGIVNSFVKETSQQNLTPEEKQKKVILFGKMLDQVTAQVAKKRGVVIVLSEAVVSGATDYTHEVMVEIKKEMKP